MRKVIMKMNVSVDGFVSGPNGENDWVFKSSDETSRASGIEQTWGAGLIIMPRLPGRRHGFLTAILPKG
jgi:hypothetical protein